ncbi:Candidapepsin-4 [Orbilia brochopaga]|nr:Candidapepsin-4 [Drechslerella brochopaga]
MDWRSWVASGSSKSCGSPSSGIPEVQCSSANWSSVYDPSNSTTFENTSLSDPADVGNSVQAGYLGIESIKLGRIELDNVAIGIAENFTGYPALGIGPVPADAKDLLKTQGLQGSLRALNQGKSIDTSVIGFYSDWMETNQSIINFGSVDTAKYLGDLVTFNATGEQDINNIQLLSASYRSQGPTLELAKLNNIVVRIQLETDYIYLPDSDFNLIVKQVGAEYDATCSCYFVDCRQRESDSVFEFRFQNVSITVLGHHFILPAYYNGGNRQQLRNEDTCELKIKPMSDYSSSRVPYDAVLGIPFVRHIYLVHDYTNRQLSFAPAKFNVTESNIIQIDSSGVASLSTPTAPTPTCTHSQSNANATVTGLICGIIGIFVIAIGVVIYVLKRRKTRIVSPPSSPSGHPTMLQLENLQTRLNYNPLVYSELSSEESAQEMPSPDRRQ